MALLHQLAELLDEARDARGVGGIAFDHEVMTLRANAHVEERFELAQVVVERSEERGHAGLGNRDFAQ